MRGETPRGVGKGWRAAGPGGAGAAAPSHSPEVFQRDGAAGGSWPVPGGREALQEFVLSHNAEEKRGKRK